MSANMASADIRTEDITGGSPVGGSSIREPAAREVNRLFADVEDLLRKVAHMTDADIARVRQKVERTLAAAKDSAARAGAGARQVATTADKYVHDQPWTALGIAAAVGIVLGMLSTKR